MSRKDDDYSEHRTITEWVRPNGERKDMRVPLTVDAAAVFDAVVAAGYAYSIEWCGTFYAFYISADDIEMDVVTDLIKGETSNEQRGQLSRAIVRNTVAVLNRKKQELIAMSAGSEGDL